MRVLHSSKCQMHGGDISSILFNVSLSACYFTHLDERCNNTPFEHHLDERHRCEVQGNGRHVDSELLSAAMKVRVRYQQ